MDLQNFINRSHSSGIISYNLYGCDKISSFECDVIKVRSRESTTTTKYKETEATRDAHIFYRNKDAIIIFRNFIKNNDLRLLAMGYEELKVSWEHWRHLK